MGLCLARRLHTPVVAMTPAMAFSSFDEAAKSGYFPQEKIINMFPDSCPKGNKCGRVKVCGRCKIRGDIEHMQPLSPDESSRVACMCTLYIRAFEQLTPITKDPKALIEWSRKFRENNTQYGHFYKQATHFGRVPLEETDFPYLIQNPNVTCLLYTSPSPRDLSTSRMPSSA